jgi:hypothetical protein
LRSKAPQRVEVAPQHPDYLAALLARADQAVRLAPSSERRHAGKIRARAVS